MAPAWTTESNLHVSRRSLTTWSNRPMAGSRRGAGAPPGRAIACVDGVRPPTPAPGRRRLGRRSRPRPMWTSCLADRGGDRTAHDEFYAKLATALGADLGLRLYPDPGPAIRRRHPARILEALLGQIHTHGGAPIQRWQCASPSRGWIDFVLHGEHRGWIILATEIESDLRRLEQLLVALVAGEGGVAAIVGRVVARGREPIPRSC